MSIGNRLRAAIEQQGGSIKDFSRRSGIPYRTLQNYLSGERLPGADALVQIARQGIDVNWMLTGESLGKVIDNEKNSVEAMQLFLGKIIDDKNLQQIAIEASFASVDRHNEDYTKKNGVPMKSISVISLLMESYKFYSSIVVTLYDILPETEDKEVAYAKIRNSISALQSVIDSSPNGAIDLGERIVKAVLEGSKVVNK